MKPGRGQIRPPAPEPAFGPQLVIEPGLVFSTDFERGCVAVTIPDIRGTFDATDSDGVTCLFSTMMVRGHRDYIPCPIDLGGMGHE
jgi:hypothetical protein